MEPQFEQQKANPRNSRPAGSGSPISFGRFLKILWIAACVAIVVFSVFFAILPRVRSILEERREKRTREEQNADWERAWEGLEKNPEFQKKLDEVVAGFPEEEREERKQMFEALFKNLPALTGRDTPEDERQTAWSAVFGVSIDLKPFVKALADEDFESARAFLGPETRKKWTTEKFHAQMTAIRALAGDHWQPEQTGFDDQSCPEGRGAEATFRLTGPGGPKLGLKVWIKGTDEGFKIVLLTLVTEKGEKLLMPPGGKSEASPEEPDKTN